MCVLVPVYWRHYGLQNFLWFSDIALFGLLAALWFESRRLASMMAVGVLLPELTWNLDFFARLLLGVPVVGLSDYMFDGGLPLHLRALSLFHVVLPPALLWAVWRLGYDRRAWRWQTALGWAVLPLTYLLTDPARNINWVFGPPGGRPSWMPGAAHLLLMMALFPLVIYLPTHWALKRLYPRRPATAGRFRPPVRRGRP